MALREADNPDLWARVSEQNLLRQYDLLINCVEIGLEKGIDYFDEYVLWALNHAAVSNICQLGGRYRLGPIKVGDHDPPHPDLVPGYMDDFFSVIHENWESKHLAANPMMLPAFALWRLNWIHPFIEGNGRTARAVCYFLICMRAGGLLGGEKIVPERIRENRIPYYAALRAADSAYAEGQYNVTELSAYLKNLVTMQINNE